MVRHDRAKRAKKTMGFFKMNYGVKPPYFVLLDPEFIVTSLEKKVFVKTAVPELLAGSAVLVVTRCVTAHLRAGGDTHAGAALMAKRLQHEDCSHDKATNPHECLYNLLRAQEGREKKLCLASQNPAFRKRVRAIPGVPIVHIYNNMVILDTPSAASTKHAETKARSHRSPKPAEQELVKEVAPPKEEGNNKEPKKAIPYRLLAQRKRAKAPNPLSVKKKAKKTPSTGKAAPNVKPNTDKSTATATATATASTSTSTATGAPDNTHQQHTTQNSSKEAHEEKQPAKRRRKRKRKHGGNKKADADGDGKLLQPNCSDPAPPGKTGEGGPLAKKRKVE